MTEINPYVGMEKRYKFLLKKSLKIGLTREECTEHGSFVRKISGEMRKKWRIEALGYDNSGIIYNHYFEDGLHKMIIDKRKMTYKEKKLMKESDQCKAALHEKEE